MPPHIEIDPIEKKQIPPPQEPNRKEQPDFIRPQPQSAPPNTSSTIKWLILFGLGFLFLVVLMRVLLREKKDETIDSQEFLDALDAIHEEILNRASGSPREIRRILNNIRLIAAGLPIPPQPAPAYPQLRNFKPTWADRLEHWHRKLINYQEPDPSRPAFAPEPGQIPSLMLNHATTTDQRLLDWYDAELASLGFTSPDQLIPRAP